MNNNENIFSVIKQLIHISNPTDKLERMESLKNLTPICELSVGETQPGDPEHSFYVGKVTPKEQEFIFDDLMTLIVSEELYPFYLEFDKEVFILRFNKTMFKYIQFQVLDAIKQHVPAESIIWTQPNIMFIEWFQSNGINIDEVESFIEDDYSQSDETSRGLSPNSGWKDVKITIEPDDRSDIPNLRIETPEYSDVVHPSKLGFTTKKNPNIPNQLFKTLETFALLQGEITSDSRIRVTPKTVSRLREHLLDLFGIGEAPISNYTKLNGYTCQFRIIDRRYRSDGYDSIINSQTNNYTSNQDALSYATEIEIDPVTGELKFPE